MELGYAEDLERRALKDCRVRNGELPSEAATKQGREYHVHEHVRGYGNRVASLVLTGQIQ